MRVITLVSVVVWAAGAAGCGTMGNPDPDSYLEQERQLANDCRERGGILAPTGRQSGRPQADNVCKITGEPSGLIRRN